jgi:hypothetical protein
MTDTHPYTLVNLFALVTFYYSTGGDTGVWINDRLWLSQEDHLCLWVGVTCGYFWVDGSDGNTTTTTTTTTTASEMIRDDASFDAADAALQGEERLELYYSKDTAFRVTTFSLGTCGS